MISIKNCIFKNVNISTDVEPVYLSSIINDKVYMEGYYTLPNPINIKKMSIYTIIGIILGSFVFSAVILSIIILVIIYY